MFNSDQSVLSKADWDFWNQNGYLVIPNAVPSEQLKATIIAMERFFGKDFSEPNDWYKEPLFPGGIAPMSHDQELWDNRQSPRLYQAFAELFDTEKLRVSQDRVNLNPPNKESIWDNHGIIHWDIDSTQRPIPFQIQGVLCLTDTAENQGGFRCIPGFHRELETWAESQPIDRPPRMLNTTGLNIESVPGNAGDLIIWHSALPHSNSPNTTDQPRIAQYITMNPVTGDSTGSGLLPLARTFRSVLAEALGVAEGLVGKWLLDYQESDVVLVQVDRFVGEHPYYPAWQVEFNGKMRYLRKPWVKKIDERSLAVYRPYAMGNHIDTDPLPLLDEDAFASQLVEAILRIPTPCLKPRLTGKQLDQLPKLLSQPPNQFGFDQRLWDENSIIQLLSNQFGLEIDTAFAQLTRLGRKLAGVDSW